MRGHPDRGAAQFSPRCNPGIQGGALAGGLKKLSAPTAKVIREGAVFEIPARELVPGDLILLEAGDYIPPADARLLETVNLNIDESALTGESVPVEKDADFTAEEILTLSDQKNMAYMGGTVVIGGRGGRAQVTTTGG